MLDITRAYGLTLLFPEGDNAIGASLRNYGEFARPEAELVSAYLRASPEPGVFIDVGANIGSIALPVAAANRQWKVIAIEAHRGLATVLGANALNNQLYNVETINAAAGAEAGLARFPNASLTNRINFGVLGMHLNDKTDTEAVRMCTLDEVATPNVRFVKMDVEGFEAEVLRGATSLIHTTRPIWLLEANPSTKTAVLECMSMLRNAGYGLYWLWAPFVTLNHRKPAQEPPKIRGDLNFVALPDGIANLWSLPVVGELEDPWPTQFAAHPYLARFGFRTNPG